ncbi:hypothetical protein PC119_g21124 [Phytophthora cactorum]|nr:hypothetical protein PC114_g11185 [Phytophthora cactorum]KAG2981077.1 hypothetical protein PC119_g21124 [Phytophthora cactorum]
MQALVLILVLFASSNRSSINLAIYKELRVCDCQTLPCVQLLLSLTPSVAFNTQKESDVIRSDIKRQFCSSAKTSALFCLGHCTY